MCEHRRVPDGIYSALRHPMRQRLLYAYYAAETSPSELARRWSEPLNRVAYHTNVLVSQGFVELVRTERRRGATRRWFRSVLPLAVDGNDWEALPIVIRRALVLEVLEVANTRARRAALGGGFDSREVQLTRSPLLLDDDGIEAVADLLRTAFVQLETIISDATIRDAPTRTDYDVVMLAYERPANAV